MKNTNSIYMFITGMILAFDFTGLLGHRFLSFDAEMPVKTDKDNIAADWQRVGDNFRNVMRPIK